MPPNTAEQQLRRIFYEPLALTGFVAAATSRVRIGYSVLVLPYRHPVVTAKQLATIDVMCEGRLIVGVGAGGLAAEFEALGVPFGRRGRLTDEYLRVMRELWESDEPHFAGETICFENINVFPKPVQRPLPILVGGHSPAAIRRTLEFGDGWHPSRLGPAELGPAIRDFRARCEQAGRPPLPVTMRHDLRLLDAASGPRQPFSGTPQDIAADLQLCAEAGVEEVTLDFAVPPVETGEQWLAALERFTAEVLPIAPQ